MSYAGAAGPVIDELSRRLLGRHGIVMIGDEMIGDRLSIVITVRRGHSTSAISRIMPMTYRGFPIVFREGDAPVALMGRRRFGLRGLGGTTPSPVPSVNTPDTLAFTVGDLAWGVGYATVPSLDAALEVQNVTPDQATRALQVVRETLLATGATVDRVEWGSGSIRGRIYARWKPSSARNAVTYANTVARALVNAAHTVFGPTAAIIMRRYRVDMPLGREDRYVYPEVSAATAAIDPPGAQPEKVLAQQTGATGEALILPVAGGVGAVLLLAGGVYAYRRRAMRANRRRRAAR